MEQVSSQGSVLQIADRSGQLGLQGWPWGYRLGSGRPREGGIGAEWESDLPKMMLTTW